MVNRIWNKEYRMANTTEKKSFGFFLRAPHSTFNIQHSTRAFSSVEVLLASAIFALFVTALAGAYFYGQESNALSGNRTRAVMLVDEGIEAAKNLRDEDFSNLADGTHGLSTAGNQWSFLGSSDATGVFTRQVTVATVDADRKSITSNVTWQQNQQRSGSVSAVTYLTNWLANVEVSNQCDVHAVDEGHVSGACRQNAAQCTGNGEINLASGDALCADDNPGDPAHDTCCVLESGGGGDTTAPAAVSNLAASGATSSSIDLSWTAPGDDGSTGTATSYDVRYSTATITEGNWGSATQATGEPTPSVAGTGENLTVSGLTASTLYYFAIKTSDEIPNVSAISDIASLTTSAGVSTCNDYVIGLGGYSSGICRQTPKKCTQNGETNESGGDAYCTGGASADTCCGQL